MGGLTKGQIAAAKEVGILDYVLMREPNNVKRIGNAAYRLIDHDSLIISNGLWHWKSCDIGGKNVIDYLVKVRGYSFVDAVMELASASPYQSRAEPLTNPPPVGLPINSTASDISFRSSVNLPFADPPEKQANPLTLPRRNADNKRVIEYLQNRGIAPYLIFDCIERGSLYESARFHNCVFIGRDEKHKARFAALRGTTGDFKRDAPGSDKRFGFAIPPNNDSDFGGDGSTTVAVFESPIDALSFQTLYPGDSSWKLSLGGTALSAFMQFLRTHGEVRYVTVCTDNDEAGNLAAKNIASVRGVEVTRLVPPIGKDWNETLIKSMPSREFDKREVDAAKNETAETDKNPSFIGRLNRAREIVAKVKAARTNAAQVGDKPRKHGDVEH
ncbi:topoisomerase [Clostridia bacterium]|nr:topoisomerase [Clostridia bacterium]GHV36476.1 topoisomerase [Clostridia bacterium]